MRSARPRRISGFAAFLAIAVCAVAPLARANPASPPSPPAGTIQSPVPEETPPANGEAEVPVPPEEPRPYRPPSFPKMLLLDAGHVLTSPLHWRGQRMARLFGVHGGARRADPGRRVPERLGARARAEPRLCRGDARGARRRTLVRPPRRLLPRRRDRKGLEGEERLPRRPFGQPALRRDPHAGPLHRDRTRAADRGTGRLLVSSVRGTRLPLGPRDPGIRGRVGDRDVRTTSSGSRRPRTGRPRSRPTSASAGASTFRPTSWQAR